MANFNCPYTEFPVFIRAGSIVPLRVESTFSKMGSSYSKGYVTVFISKPENGTHTKNVHEFQANGYRISYTLNKQSNQMDIYFSAHQKNRYIILLDEIKASPMVVQMNSKNLKFEKVSELSQEDIFWRTGVNAIWKPTLSRAFIKITEKTDIGLHLRLNNLI